MRFDFLISSERSGSNLISKLIDNHSLYNGPTPPHLLRVFEKNMNQYGDLTNDKNWNKFITDICEFFNCKIGVWETNVKTEELLQISKRDLAEVVKYIYFKEAKHHRKKYAFIKEVRTYNLVSFIDKYFDKPKYLWLVRDPRDMALSWSKSPVHRGDIIRGSKIWQEDQKATLKIYERIRNRVLLIKYEDLIADQEAKLIEICKFLEIEYESTMRNYHQSKMSQKNARQTDNWKNLNKEIITNNSKKYLNKLSKEQIQYIEYICFKEMEILGYELEYPILNENQFNIIREKLIVEERFEKSEYQLVSNEEKVKRTKWYKKYLEIQQNN